VHRNKRLTFDGVSRTIRCFDASIRVGMTLDQSSHYAQGPLTTLLQRELAMLTPILDGVFGVWGLHLRPHRDAPVALPQHLLSAITEMSVAADGTLEGEARCEAQHLPFASESFKLVIAQHVLEQAMAPAEVFGFNPASLWRPWLARRLPGDWRFSGPAGWRDVLARSRLDVLQVRYSGLWSPWAAADAHSDAAATLGPRALGRFCGSWLLLARKRRASLTPLRLAAVRSDLKVNPTLVPGARRECA
jgi:hypothetical protein